MNIIQTNCAKMLNARKYNNVEIQEEENTITANDSSGKNIMVLILEDDRLNINTVKSSISTFISADIDIGILLHNGDPTSSAKKTLANLDSSGRIKISIFPIENFRYCITDHRLVFPHSRLKKEEAAKIKKTYDPSKLPILMSSDVISRYYNFKPGEIISILRRDNTISYRIVK